MKGHAEGNIAGAHEGAVYGAHLGILLIIRQEKGT